MLFGVRGVRMGQVGGGRGGGFLWRRGGARDGGGLVRWQLEVGVVRACGGLGFGRGFRGSCSCSGRVGHLLLWLHLMLGLPHPGLHITNEVIQVAHPIRWLGSVGIPPTIAGRLRRLRPHVHRIAIICGPPSSHARGGPH